MSLNAHNFTVSFGRSHRAGIVTGETDRIYVEGEEDFSIKNPGLINCW